MSMWLWVLLLWFVDGSLGADCGIVQWPPFSASNFPEGYELSPLTKNNMEWDEDTCTARCAGGRLALSYDGFMILADGVQYNKKSNQILTFYGGNNPGVAKGFMCIEKIFPLHTAAQVQSTDRCDIDSTLPIAADCGDVGCTPLTESSTYTVRDDQGRCRLYCKNANSGMVIRNQNSKLFFITELFWTDDKWEAHTNVQNFYLEPVMHVSCLPPGAANVDLSSLFSTPPPKFCCGKLPQEQCENCEKTVVFSYTDDTKALTKYSCNFDDQQFMSDTTCGTNAIKDTLTCDAQKGEGFGEIFSTGCFTPKCNKIPMTTNIPEGAGKKTKSAFKYISMADDFDIAFNCPEGHFFRYVPDNGAPVILRTISDVDPPKCGDDGKWFFGTPENPVKLKEEICYPSNCSKCTEPKVVEPIKIASFAFDDEAWCMKTTFTHTCDHYGPSVNMGNWYTEIGDSITCTRDGTWFGASNPNARVTCFP